jgi:predicted Zn-dependent protease with MMP-like domain
VPLSRLFPGERSLPPRVVLYRRPIETRVEDAADLAGIVNDIVVEQLAGALGVEPSTLDPDYGTDE